MIQADCYECDSIHPLGARPAVPGTTECPDCGAYGYRSVPTEDDDRSQEAKIHDAVDNVDGVGTETRENIKAEFDYFAELRSASVDELKQIDGVGQKTAERIQSRVQ